MHVVLLCFVVGCFQEEIAVDEEVPEVTHRVYLDVAIDGQNAGMGKFLSCCFCSF